MSFLDLLKEAIKDKIISLTNQNHPVKNDVSEVFDPITKKNVPRKPIKQQAGGTVTRNGVPFTPKKKEKPSQDSVGTGNSRNLEKEEAE
jgi:hypothetical protein